jgi:hypothetical protein
MRLDFYAGLAVKKAFLCLFVILCPNTPPTESPDELETNGMQVANADSRNSSLAVAANDVQ